MAAKQAWQVRQGMQLETMDPEYPYQVVESVYAVDGIIHIQTDQTAWIFKQNELVKFPRRPDGDTYLWGVGGEKVVIDEICIGDIIPPKEGWVDADGLVTDPNEVFENGFIVNSLAYSKMGKTFSVKRIGSETIASVALELFVQWNSRILYEDPTTVVHDNRSIDGQARRHTNVSGYYQSTEDGRIVRFRLAGMRGRPPVDAEFPPKSPAGWDKWRLLTGAQKHPADPR